MPLCTTDISYANQTDRIRTLAWGLAAACTTAFAMFCTNVPIPYPQQVTIVRKGKCSNKQVKSTEDLPLGAKVGNGASCPCPKILKWVCGKDGVSYSNDCLAKCNGTTVAYDGRCADPGESTRTGNARVWAWSTAMCVRRACIGASKAIGQQVRVH